MFQCDSIPPGRVLLFSSGAITYITRRFGIISQAAVAKPFKEAAEIELWQIWWVVCVGAVFEETSFSGFRV